MLDPAFVDELRGILGPEGLIESGEDLLEYGSDRCRGDWPVAPSLIARPKTVEQVQASVRACAARAIAIVPSGGRTGLAGAATATRGEVVLSLSRMTRILSVDPTARLLRCEAGATVEAVQEAAAAHGLAYPVDFAAKGSAHIGGSIATNAGGVKVLRFGSTREWVSGLEVVWADGEFDRIGGELVKNNTGYDLRQLLIGSEGTLAIIVAATLELTSKPAPACVALVALADDAAVLELFARLRESSLVLAAFECFDRACMDRVHAQRGGSGRRPLVGDEFERAVLIEVECAQDSERDRLIELLDGAQDVLLDAVVAASEAQARELWAWREDISEALHRHRPHKADVALPIRQVGAFLARWRVAAREQLDGIEALVFGHVGDGNLHLNLLCPAGLDHADFLARCHAFDRIGYGLVREFEGSVSAEHGIGLLKREYLGHTRSVREIELMRAIKSAFDPQGILNPGKVL